MGDGNRPHITPEDKWNGVFLMSDFDNVFTMTEDADPIGEDLRGDAFDPATYMPDMKKGRRSATDRLVEEIQGFYLMVGATLLVHPNPKVAADGAIIMQNATTVAQSWHDPIEKNPTIKKMWQSIFRVSGYSACVMAHVVLAMAIASNHGVKVPDFSSIVNRPSEVIEEDMEDAG